MLTLAIENLKTVAANRSVGTILLHGLLIRLILLAYSAYHDTHIDHVKYTDIDYHVFTNGSKAIFNQESPYNDQEYRYSPLVALIFVPNILLKTELFGKLLLIFVDIVCGQLLYRLNINQGTDRLRSRLFLVLWLLNPVTLAISTRGSFEPILTLFILSSVYMLIKSEFVLAGFLYGLTIHLKLYPIIYSLCFYGYIIQKRPQLVTQTRVIYWLRTISPGINHIKFFLSALLSLSASCYISYLYFGRDYIEKSFIYHIRRRDLQHNFSIYFYLFRLFPQYQEQISYIAFIIQFAAILIVTLVYFILDTNRRVKSRKLNFNLFTATFIFVSLNKVCTSQYFSWYLTFLPLISDSLNIDSCRAVWIATAWFLSQANWLVFAYLYEFLDLDVINHVGISSLLFLMSNLWILLTLCQHFEPASKNRKALED